MARIDELSKRIAILNGLSETARRKKEEIIELMKDLSSQLNFGRISKKEYYDKLGDALNLKSPEEWVKYYDNYIAECNSKIMQCRQLMAEEKSFGNREKRVRVLQFLVLIAAAGLIFALIYNFGPVAFEKIHEGKIKMPGLKFPSNITKTNVGEVASIGPLAVEVKSKNPNADFNEKTIQGSAIVGENVRWTSEIEMKSGEEFSLNIPTGKIVSIKDEEGNEIKSINNLKGGKNYSIEFETPAPTISKEVVDENKERVVISSPVHYKEILSSIDISEKLNLKKNGRAKLKLYQIINNKGVEERMPVNLIGYDTNEDGVIDKAEWVTPHLSDAVFEFVIIEITKAEHLDADRNFVSDIYESARARDNIWSEKIRNNEYVRINFEKNLTNKNDITLYVRGADNSSALIEVYVKDGNELITRFENVSAEKEYKVYLNNLGEMIQGSFDLKIIGEVEIDYIVDPSYACTGTASYQTVTNHQCGPSTTYYACEDFNCVQGINCYYSSDGLLSTSIQNLGGTYLDNWINGYVIGDLGSRKCVSGILLRDINYMYADRGDVYLSDDGINWGSPLATNLLMNPDMNIYYFAETPARYIKVYVHDCELQGMCNIAEYQPLTRPLSCIPDTCISLGKNCGGPYDDGCGGTIPSCGTCSGSQQCQLGVCIDKKLVAYYAFEGNANDMSGNGNHGINNGATLISGKLGQAYSFNGANNYINITKSQSLSTTSAFTHAYWIKANSFSNTPVIINNHIQGFGTPISGVVDYINPTGIKSFQLRVNNICCQTLNSNNLIPVGNWVYIVNTWDGSIMKTYINGIAETNTLSNSGILEINRNTYIGINAENVENSVEPLNAFNGLIDEVKIWNYALTPEEVLTEYNSVSYSLENCRVLSESNKIYTLNSNIINLSLTDNCINISAPNITLDCNGFYILSTKSYAGIYSNASNITIKNCNVSMGSGGEGIYLYKSNNSRIYNNTMSSAYYGIYLYSGSNNSFININADNNNYGIYLYSGSNNSLTNITANNNSYAIYLSSSSNNSLTNITANNSQYTAIYLTSSSNNSLTNITANNNGYHGVYLYSSSNNNSFTDLIANNNSQNGVYLYSSSSNTFTNIISLNNSIYGIFLASSSNSNNFKDIIANNNTGDGILVSQSSNNRFSGISLSNNRYGILISWSPNNFFKDGNVFLNKNNDIYGVISSVNNTFVNVSYDISRESLDSGSQIIRKWYYRAYVKDGNGREIDKANITAFNISVKNNFNLTTNSSGWTNITEIMDYINNGGARNFYSNYVINATNGTSKDEHTFNASLGNNLMDVFILGQDYAPKIIHVEPIATVFPLAGGVRNVSVNFSVYDSNGFANINASSARAILSKNGIVRQNISCILLGNYNIYYSNYSCMVGMWFFDSPGFWNINVSIGNMNGNYAVNDTTNFNYAIYFGWVMKPGSLNWSNLMPGTGNQIADNNLTIYNLGNVNITDVIINASNLIGETNNNYNISAGNFSVNGCSLTRMIENQNVSSYLSINFTQSTFSVNASGNLSFCVKDLVMNIPAQSYSSTRDWIIDTRFVMALAAFAINARRKKKKIKKVDKNILEALEANKKEIMSYLNQEIIKIKREMIETKENKEDEIPISIFNNLHNNIGAAEALARYLHENKKLRFSEIAKLINRDQRTVWVNYKNSLKYKKLEVKEKGVRIPSCIFSDRRLSILESIIKYLREKNYKNSDIAEILNKDPRNIGTFYSRAIRKSLSPPRLKK